MLSRNPRLSKFELTHSDPREDECEKGTNEGTNSERESRERNRDGRERKRVGKRKKDVLGYLLGVGQCGQHGQGE